VETAATIIAAAKVSNLTEAHARDLAQFLLDLSPYYGNAESLAQLVAGKSSITGEEVNKF
jgi:hypothetical protein